MSSVYEAKEEKHRLEAVCAAMKNRGGYDGSYDEAVKIAKKRLLRKLCALSFPAQS